MRQLHVSRTIAAPLPVAWTLLVSVDRWPQWGPSIRAVETESAHIALGSRGTIVTVFGARLPFEVTELTPNRSWSWRVAGVPATSHRVQPGGHGTRVTFGVPWWAAPYLAVCAIALRRLERLALGVPTE